MGAVMIFDEVFRGFVIGLTVSIPVVPIALLFLRRSIEDGRVAGMASGFGAATVDIICGTVAALGLNAVTLLIEHHEYFLRVVGGLFLLGYGVHTLLTRDPKESRRPIHEQNLWRAYFSTALLTIANPLTLTGLVLVSAASGVGAGSLSSAKIAWLVCGIFFGSASWWCTLSASAEWLGRKLGPKLLLVINTVAGIILLGVAIYQIGDVVVKKWL